MEIESSPVIVNASQLERGRTYLRISDARFVHESYGRDRWTVNLAARHHPRSERYDVPAAVRAVVHAYERPGSVVCGFSALALYGLPFLVEGADTTLRAPIGRCSPASAFAPAISRLRAPHTETWTLTHRGVPIRVATPARATAQALQQIRRGEHSWQTEPVPGVQAEVVRAVQLVDCVRRYLNLQVTEVNNATTGQLNQRWMTKVIQLSRDRRLPERDRAASPPSTGSEEVRRAAGGAISPGGGREGGHHVRFRYSRPEAGNHVRRPPPLGARTTPARHHDQSHVDASRLDGTARGVEEHADVRPGSRVGAAQAIRSAG